MERPLRHPDENSATENFWLVVKQPQNDGYNMANILLISWLMMMVIIWLMMVMMMVNDG